jgi:hypothetical protein
LVLTGEHRSPEFSMFDAPRRSPALILFVLLAIVQLLPARTHSAELQPVDASLVKAAFVTNFPLFVDWPASQLGAAPLPLVIAVLGDPEFAAVLEQSAVGKAVGGHPIQVKKVARAEEARDAHLLFIGAAEAANLPGILKTIEDCALLTVGDTDGFARAGVVLNLYTFDQRIRIEVNTAAAARARLRLSAHLLRIARIVG